MLVVSVLHQDKSRFIDSEHAELSDACAVAVELADRLSVRGYHTNPPQIVEIHKGTELVIGIQVMPEGLVTRQLRGRLG